MTAKFNIRSGDISIIDGAMNCLGRCSVSFALLSVWCFTGIAPAAAHGQDQLVQATPATHAVDTQEGSHLSSDVADAQKQQTQAAKPEEPKDQGQATGAKSSEKKGEWLLAPIPVKSPAIGSGLEWAVARLFPFNKKDEISPASAVGVAGIFTNNGSRGIVIGSKLYLKEDKYRIAAAIASASINFDVYGVGAAAGRQGTFVPLNVKGGVGIGEFLYRIRKSIYLGARGQYRNATLSLNQDRLNSSDITSQPPDNVAGVVEQISNQLLRQTTVSLGPRFQWDTRDSVFYPKRGFLAEIASDFFSTGLGSKWSYQYYKVSFNKYSTLSKHQILAFRGMGCAAAGDHVPIYDLCLFGTSNDLRGYTAGRYQDRRMFATQAEYRLMFPSSGFLGRFGVVAFAGVGAIGNKFTNIGQSDLLSAGGAGLRFRLLKKYPINFRIDYGQGKDGHTLSIGVLEAF
jgi:surface antigen Omp85-like protein